MKFTNNNIKKDVEGELEDLKAVLDIVSQLPKDTALRILVYCHRFIEDDNKIQTPIIWGDSMGAALKAAIEKVKEKKE